LARPAKANPLPQDLIDKPIPEESHFQLEHFGDALVQFPGELLHQSVSDRSTV
jgi:hypothetical protein